MTNAERASAIVEHWNPDIPRDDWKEHIEYFSSALDEAEARGYERATNELAAKESEISRSAYNRALDDAAEASEKEIDAWWSFRVGDRIRALAAREESK